MSCLEEKEEKKEKERKEHLPKNPFRGCYVKEQSPLFFPFSYPRNLKSRIKHRINEIIKFRVQLIVDRIICYLFNKGKFKYEYEYEYDFKNDEFEQQVMIEVFKSLNILGMKCKMKKEKYLIQL